MIFFEKSVTRVLEYLIKLLFILIIINTYYIVSSYEIQWGDCSFYSSIIELQNLKRGAYSVDNINNYYIVIYLNGYGF